MIMISRKLIGLFSAIVFSLSMNAQPLTDSASARAYIDANIVTNGSKAITAVKMNRILTGYLNFWTKYSIDSIRLVEGVGNNPDIVEYRKDDQWYSVFDLPGAPGGDDGAIQYRNGGTFDGSDGKRFDQDGVTIYSFGYRGTVNDLPNAKIYAIGDTTIQADNLVSNGSFTGNADEWTLDGMTYGSNMISGTGTANQEFGLDVGETYIFSFDIVGGDEAGSVDAYLGGGVSQSFSSIGTHTITGKFVTGMGFSIAFSAGAEFTGSIDNVSVFHAVIQDAARFDGRTEFHESAQFFSATEFQDQATFQDAIKFQSLGGSGDGFVAVDNDGDLYWSSGPLVFYNADGSLSSNRTVSLNNQQLLFDQNGTPLLHLNGAGDEVKIRTNSGSTMYNQSGADVTITSENLTAASKYISIGAAQSLFYLDINDGATNPYLRIDTVTDQRTMYIGFNGGITNNTNITLHDRTSTRAILYQSANGHEFYGASRFRNGFGYGPASAAIGGAVTQATDKTTAVTLNKECGEITMNGAALAANTTVYFTLNNTKLINTDLLITNVGAAGSFGKYTVQVYSVLTGSAAIAVTNISGGSLSEAVKIRFAIVHAVLN